MLKIHPCSTYPDRGHPGQILSITRAIGVSIAKLNDDQDATAKKVADLSDEAIEFARTWQRLPVERRAAVEALAEQTIKGTASR